MQLVRNHAALIVVDMQNGFCNDAGSIARIGFDISMLKAAVAPCVRLVAAARRAGVPVIHTRYVYQPGHSDGGLLVDALMPELKAENALIDGDWDAETVAAFVARPDDLVIDKNRPSAFFRTRLDAEIAARDIRRLVICGVTTSCCVETTVRDASQRDLETFVVGDATGELDPARHAAALTTIGLLFGRVVTVADVESAFA